MSTERSNDWPPQRAPDACVEERARMIREQLIDPRDGRIPITSRPVLEAMQRVPRHTFVPQALHALAHADKPLSIGEQQTISQPYIVARMLELLEISPQDKVLDVGTGSGYQAALLYELTPYVYSIEVRPALLEAARAVLSEQAYQGVALKLGDGNLGWKEESPFTRIIVACAAKSLPQELWNQLAPYGRMLIPLEDPHGGQSLYMIEKRADGSQQRTRLTRVSFVPFIDSDAAAQATH